MDNWLRELRVSKIKSSFVGQRKKQLATKLLNSHVTNFLLEALHMYGNGSASR